jgi:hypothetical protein
MTKESLVKAGAIKAAVLTAAMMAVNALANILPLNGLTTGELSDALPNLFVPAGLTFSIWGLIYLLLIGYVVALLYTVFSKPMRPGWDMPEAWAYNINVVCNALWIFAWHWQRIGLSLLIMMVILLTLIVLAERHYKAFAHQEKSSDPKERLRRTFLRTPIHVYLGWICVATIANVTALLVSIGWNGIGLSHVAWTVIMLLAGTVIAVLLTIRRKAWAAVFVFLWAYLGIVIKQSGTESDASSIIVVAAVVCMVIIAGCMVIVFLQSKKVKDGLS